MGCTKNGAIVRNALILYVITGLILCGKESS